MSLMICPFSRHYLLASAISSSQSGDISAMSMNTGSLTPFYIDERVLGLLVSNAIAAGLHVVVKDYMRLYLYPFFLF